MMTQMLRIAAVIAMTGNKRWAVYRNVRAGLLPPPVKIGERSSAWPRNEIEQITAARIAGHTNDEIKSLVSRLLTERKKAVKNVQ